MTGKKLENALKAAGIKVLDSYERSSDMDAGCDLEGNKDVQIFGRELILNQWVEDDEAYWPLGTFKDTNSLIEFLKK